MRFLLRLPALAGLAFALVPGASRADESGGLPQLDVHSFSSQLFWLATFFVIVYVFMRNVGVPRVAAIIEQRRKQIGDDVSEAERLRLAAEEARKTYEATMAEAHGKARKLIAETHESNITILTEKTRAATAASDVMIGDAVKRIEAAKTGAMQSIREVAQGLAAEITQKLVGRSPDAANVAKAVDAAAGQGVA